MVHSPHLSVVHLCLSHQALEALAAAFRRYHTPDGSVRSSLRALGLWLFFPSFLLPHNIHFFLLLLLSSPSNPSFSYVHMKYFSIITFVMVLCLSKVLYFYPYHLLMFNDCNPTQRQAFVTSLGKLRIKTSQSFVDSVNRSLFSTLLYQELCYTLTTQ